MKVLRQNLTDSVQLDSLASGKTFEHAGRHYMKLIIASTAADQVNLDMGATPCAQLESGAFVTLNSFLTIIPVDLVAVESNEAE